MKLLQKLRALFRRKSLDAEMAEEMRGHLEMQTQANLARGMSPEEARFAARREFGGMEQFKESARDQRGLVWLGQLVQDFNYGLRSLRKSSGFTAVAVLTLGLGIGVNSTMFSIVNDMIVRPALRDHRQNLVALHTARAGADRNFRPFSFAEFTTLRNATELFADVAAMQFSSSLMGADDSVERRMVCLVSGNYFALLNVRPLRGRFFSTEETQPAVDLPVAVASYDLWQRLGAREDFLGSRIRIDGVETTIIGIAPAGFGGLHWSNGPDAWLPLGRLPTLPGAWGMRSGATSLLDPRFYMLQLFGSLRPGLTLATAHGMLAPLNARLNQQAGANATDSRELLLTAPPRFNLNIIWPVDESGVLLYATAAVAMTVTVLLVACLNVANMLFSRGVSRRKEIAIRLSLGASRGRVIRQLLVEGLLLAGIGGLVGLLLSRWSNHLLLELTSGRAGPYVLHLRTTFDWPLLAGTFGLCLLATLVVSLAPALRSTRLNLVEDLKKQSGEATGTGRLNRFFSLRSGLVMTQIALSLALLFSASLLVHAVVNSENDRGFETDDRVVANLDYFLAKTPLEEVGLRQRALLARVAELPGIESAALASAVPFNFESNRWRLFPVGAEAAEREDAVGGSGGAYTGVSHGYFKTMGIPLLRGRDFTAAEALDDRGPRVIVIDDTLAKTLFGARDPLGRRVALSQSDADGAHRDREMEVVGIVRSPRDDAFQPTEALRRFYLPFGQAPRPMKVINTYLHVKLAASSPMLPAIQMLRRELRVLDRDTPVLACEPLASFIGKNLNVWTLRLLVVIFSVFGLIAVVLAVVGVYGVKSYLVAARTREIGVRIAIGAQTRDVLALFLKQSVLQTAVGILAGLSLAVGVGLLLSKLLYRVSPVDPVALAGAALLLAIVSSVACLIPAWRATRIDPVTALRDE